MLVLPLLILELLMCIMTCVVLVVLTMLLCWVMMTMFELCVIVCLMLALISGARVCSAGIVRCRTPVFTSVWPVLLRLRNGISVVVIEMARTGEMLTHRTLPVDPSSALFRKW